ncbi:MAG: WhiB family transcriptional regulator [Micromonosporaceae bacterium]
MGRYRTWGLDTPRNPAWWHQARCRGLTQMYFTRNPSVAAQAVHLCTHCPVLASCRREAEALTPVGAVQAGVWYADGNSSAAGPRKRQPATVGCGPWCAHLRRRTEQRQ